MAQVYNHDIVGLINRHYRIMEELHKSQSSNKAGMKGADQLRLIQYIKELRSQISWVQAQPELDLPESHPHQFDLEEIPVLSRVDNEAVNDLIRMLNLSCYELLHSASARDSARLNSYDLERCSKVIDKCESYLMDHIQPSTPGDYPESMPRDAMSGAGRTGV